MSNLQGYQKSQNSGFKEIIITLFISFQIGFKKAKIEPNLSFQALDRRVEFAENHAGHLDQFVQIYAGPLKNVLVRKTTNNCHFKFLTKNECKTFKCVWK